MSQEFQPNVELQHRWSAQLCLTLPPSYIQFLPVGSQAVLTINRNVPNQPIQYFTIFMIQLKSLNHGPGNRMNEIIVPLKYDHNTSFTGKTWHFKVGCVFSMVILSEFRMGQYRDDDYREDVPHFIHDTFL